MSQAQTFASARSTAERMARAELQASHIGSPPEVLSDQHLEAAGCWVFFLADHIPLPPKGQGALIFTAYAVAKCEGVEAACIYDFRPSVNQMQEYLQVWSLRALGKKAEARAAIEAFNAKYAAAS